MSLFTLGPNDYGVAFADKNTGDVLNTDLSNYEGNGEIYRKFQSLNEARKYLQQVIKRHKDVEGWIVDGKGKEIERAP